VQTTPQQVKLDQAELAAQAWLASKALAAAAVAAQAEAAIVGLKPVTFVKAA
jgi:hypothetical protein